MPGVAIAPPEVIKVTSPPPFVAPNVEALAVISPVACNKISPLVPPPLALTDVAKIEPPVVIRDILPPLPVPPSVIALKTLV